MSLCIKHLQKHPFTDEAVVGIPYKASTARYLDLRFREVEDLLGIPTQNAVCDLIVFSVCGLEEIRKGTSFKVILTKAEA